MGFLSSLLTIGGAIAGSFVGAPGLGASLGGAIGGAIDQSSASSSAAKSQVEAQREAAAERAAAAAKVSTIQQPFLQAGYTGINALTSRLGLDPAAVSSATAAARAGSPVGPPGAVPANALAPSAPTAFASFPASGTVGNALTPALAAADLNRTSSQGVAPDPSTTITYPGATLPTPQNMPPDSAPPAVPLTTAGPQPTNALAPSGSAYPVTNGTDPGTFGDTTNPTQPGTYTAPKAFSYGLSDYTASPAYQYQQDQARKATLAGASATGALQSGAAMKALQDRAQNIAYQDFTGERAFAAGQNQLNVTNALNAYDTNQNVYDNNRNYLTNRFDTQTDNLFKYTGAGQGAATAIGNAELGVGTANANGIVAAGNAQAGNALQQGQIGSTLAGNVAGLVGSGVTNYLNGPGTPINLQTAPNALGITMPAVNANPTFVNPLPTTPFGF